MAATILNVYDLAKAFGSEQIFSGVSFQLLERERVALVGVNGAGKSTLMRIVAGLELPDAGVFVPRSGLRIAYQAQEARFDEGLTLREAALGAFDAVRAVGERIGQIERHMTASSGEELDALFDEYARLSAEFEAAGGYDIEHRTNQVLAGLGFVDEDYDVPAGELSGGQKTRLALARTLLSEPDLLLLDEPTNHLDLAAIEWLESFLRDWKRAVLVVSHDRYFLDRVTERTLELSFGTLEDYPAGYSRYLRLREERLTRRLAEYEEQQRFIARTEEFIRKYRAGQRAREARGRQTRLDRLERIERPREHDSLRIRLSSGLRSGRTVLSTTELSVGYPARPGETEPTGLFTTPELTVERGDRVALVGPNGAGKTSLLRILTGDLEPLKGRLQFGTNVKPGYYAQGHEGLDLDQTALTTILRARPIGEEAARSLLGHFLFSGDDAYKPVSALSGGERSRLALARLTLENANLLILDEPTNHLDIASREALEELLEDFDGTILFVSHDRFLIERIANRVWAVEAGRLATYLGNYSDYVRQRERSAAAASIVELPKAPQSSAGQVERRETPRTSDRERRQLQQDLSAAERLIGKLEARLNDLNDAISIATIDQDVEQIAELGRDYEQAQEDLERAYAQWEELGARLDAALEAATR